MSVPLFDVSTKLKRNLFFKSQVQPFSEFFFRPSLGFGAPSVNPFLLQPARAGGTYSEYLVISKAKLLFFFVKFK